VNTPSSQDYVYVNSKGQTFTLTQCDGEEKEKKNLQFLELFNSGKPALSQAIFLDGLGQRYIHVHVQALNGTRVATWDEKGKCWELQSMTPMAFEEQDKGTKRKDDGHPPL